MKFKVGQKVVCIDDNFDTSNDDFNNTFRNLPKKDQVYTIREYDSPAVKLEEISNPLVPIDLAGEVIYEEPGFHEKRFAPLLSVDSDMYLSMEEHVKKQVEKEHFKILKGIDSVDI